MGFSRFRAQRFPKIASGIRSRVEFSEPSLLRFCRDFGKRVRIVTTGAVNISISVTNAPKFFMAAATFGNSLRVDKEDKAAA